MTRQLENRIANLTDRVEELADHVAELDAFRAWVLDPDPSDDAPPAPLLDGAGTQLDRTELDALGEPTAEPADDDPEPSRDAGTVEVVDRDGGGWRTVRNSATGEERRVQGHAAEAEAIRELSS